MMLENGHNIYQCQDQPVQLCPFIDKVRDQQTILRRLYRLGTLHTKTYERIG